MFVVMVFSTQTKSSYLESWFLRQDPFKDYIIPTSLIIIILMMYIFDMLDQCSCIMLCYN